MKREIGESVVVRKNLEIDKTYGEFYFVDDMVRCLGVHSTIVSVGRDGTYRIAADNSRWYWTEEMFEEKTSDVETSYYDLLTIERLARNGPIHVQRFEGGWKIIEKEDGPNEDK